MGATMIPSSSKIWKLLLILVLGCLVNLPYNVMANASSTSTVRTTTPSAATPNTCVSNVNNNNDHNNERRTRRSGRMIIAKTIHKYKCRREARRYERGLGWNQQSYFNRRRQSQQQPQTPMKHSPLLSMMFPAITQLSGGAQSSEPPSDDDEMEESSSGSTSSSSEDDEEEEEEESPQLQLFQQSKLKMKTLRDKRRQFLDHIALISTSFLKKEEFAHLNTTESVNMTHPDAEITEQTDLSRQGRHFHIVTTAALPWMTGTAVNPLLRAAYLHRRTQRINGPPQLKVDLSVVLDDPSDDLPTYNTTTTAVANHDTLDHNNNNNNNNTQFSSSQQQQQQQWVTLVIPWLELEEDQMELYGQVFASPQAQEDYIRDWLANHAGMPDVADAETGLKLLFYPARYHSGLRSIFAMGDICQLISPEIADVCVLEEPEHCNWYRAPGDSWTQKFNYVVGIVHTNYKEYASAHYSGLWTAPAIALISSAMVRAYCHQVIKLSDVLQTFAPEKEATSNVHGVRADFLEIGLERARQWDAERRCYRDTGNDNESRTMMAAETYMPAEAADNADSNVTSVYFIGKLLWAKGLDLLLELQDYYKSATGNYFAIDIYGSGPEQKAIRRAYWGRKLVKKHPHHHRSQNGTTTQNHTHHKHNGHHSHHLHRHHRQHRKRQAAAKMFTSKQAFKEQMAKLKESIPNADDWRQFKESLSATELPSTLHEWRRQPIPATFPGRVDHASLGRQGNYKVFVNPSVSEVLCTTTAEALAMGKFAIIPVHPSNAFFLKFPNCLAYRNKFEFAANLNWALTHDPEPLTPELAHEFTWEAATDRFIQASAVTWKEARERDELGFTKKDERIAWFLNELGKGPKGDILRKVFGAGPVSAQVKYVLENQGKILVDDEEDEDEQEEGRAASGEADIDEDDEDEGLTKKFHQSSFVQALQATLANGLPSNMVQSAEE